MNVYKIVRLACRWYEYEYEYGERRVASAIPSETF